MKTLKALIGKHNIKGAGRQSKLYCIANYDDDLIIPRGKVVRAYSNDNVEIYVMYEEELKNYLKDLEDMVCFIYRVKDPDATINDITNVIRRNNWNGDIDSRYKAITLEDLKKYI